MSSQLSHLESGERGAPETWMHSLPRPAPPRPMGPWLSLPTFAEAAEMSQMIAGGSLLAPRLLSQQCLLKSCQQAHSNLAWTMLPLCALSNGSAHVLLRGPWALAL